MIPTFGLVLALALPLGPVQETDADREARARLLHLPGGAVLRGDARWNGEAWELRQGGDWRTVPVVERVELESDVRRELRRRQRELGGGTAAQRVALARWMHAEGLATESLAELDDVLAAAPDHRAALDFLRQGALAIALPPLDVPLDELAEARERYLRFAAGLAPAARELAVRGLLQLENPIELQAALEAELAGGSPRRRSLAALALRRLFPGRSLEPLLARSVLDASSDVRRSAALALAAAGDEAVAAPLVRALGSEHGAVRANAAEALGHAGYRAAVPSLVEHLATLSLAAPAARQAPASHVFVGRQLAYIQDYDVEVAQFASIADPRINTLTEGDLLDVRVQGVSTYSVAHERSTVRRALATLTGADPGHTTRAWREWWEEHRETWLARRPSSGER